MASYVHKQPLPALCCFRACLCFQSRIIFQRATQKNVVPRPHVVHRHLDLRVVVLDGNLLPVLIEIRMRQPIREIGRQTLRFRRF